MDKGLVKIYCGDGKGKTTAALGQGILAASKGETVIIIQFLKGRQAEEIDFIQRLEPEIKVFRFEKFERFFEELTAEEQQDEIMNIKNGLNFAKKVLVTEECDVLILDEVLGLLDYNILTAEDLKALIEAKDEEMDLILTGINLAPSLCELADEVYNIQTVKNSIDNKNQ